MGVRPKETLVMEYGASLEILAVFFFLGLCLAVPVLFILLKDRRKEEENVPVSQKVRARG
jgi:hypothetical protein